MSEPVTVMKALILAAGFGTRLRPHTLHTPKPLFPLGGRPLLDIWIQNLIRAGCEAIAVNTHHLHDRIAAFVTAQNYPVPVHICHEPEIQGAGGAIRNLSDFWDERPFMVVNSDVLTDLDLKQVYDFHMRHDAPVTLVLCDDPEFNTVTISPDMAVTGFDGPSPDLLSLTFTGIQVLTPEILDFIPEHGEQGSIDAFRRMIAAGRRIAAFVPDAIQWRDLGTPERYREAVLEHMIPEAFSRAWPKLPLSEITQVRLAGDGSDRGWFRLNMSGKTLILADHGIREQADKNSEADAFIAIGRHLRQKGVPVPKIHAQEAFAGLVILEDLGDTHLQAAVQGAEPPEILRLYKSVIDRLIAMCLDGADGFDPLWTWQTARYDAALILEKECRYFADAFLGKYMGQADRFEYLRTEFEYLTERALSGAVTGFMHRDFQSRNIMIRDNTPYFIDFQGGRTGPLQYDLASLLIDPYVALPIPLQDALFHYALEQTAARVPLDPEQFTDCYRYCALSRNLQMLGAFGFLTCVKGKDFFEKYIPQALAGLERLLGTMDPAAFPRLRETVRALCRR